jgi:hypothetical protein
MTIKTNQTASMFTGGNSKNWDRVDNDYYATPPKDTRKFLDIYDISKFNKILEPSCGEGHMSKVLEEYISKSQYIISRDLVDRGYGEVKDFLNTEDDERYDLVMTNPPFKYALEFIKKGLEVSDTVVILAKIQLLEGKARSKELQNLGLKEIYGHVERCNCWMNGWNLNPNTGKTWSGAMMMAWYVFEKDYKGKPEYNWLF